MAGLPRSWPARWPDCGALGPVGTWLSVDPGVAPTFAPGIRGLGLSLQRIQRQAKARGSGEYESTHTVSLGTC